MSADLHTFRERCEAEPILPLPASGPHAASCHKWRATEINAVSLALLTRRPLLVSGEPGTGKTQLARACAVALGYTLHAATLNSRTEAADLLWQFDAVQRLADAHGQRLQDNECYWQPQALWLAIDWAGAQDYGSFRSQSAAAPPTGHVVLLDEIDKAPSDVPNSLLDVLGERRFDIPGLGLTVHGQGDGWPLIVCTTNREKELPDAFVRRCVVLNHAVPEDDYVGWLVEYGKAHFGARDGAHAGQAEKITTDILQAAAQQLAQDRLNAQYAQVYAPGLAEYLDLLAALDRAAPGDAAGQRIWLARLNQYAFLKDTSGRPGTGLRQHEGGERALAPLADAGADVGAGDVGGPAA